MMDDGVPGERFAVELEAQIDRASARRRLRTVVSISSVVNSVTMFSSLSSAAHFTMLSESGSYFSTFYERLCCVCAKVSFLRQRPSLCPSSTLQPSTVSINHKCSAIISLSLAVPLTLSRKRRASLSLVLDEAIALSISQSLSTYWTRGRGTCSRGSRPRLPPSTPLSTALLAVVRGTREDGGRGGGGDKTRPQTDTKERID
jgi:hypothetical protein